MLGELAERSNAAVLKTVSPQGLGGSNPSLSATPAARNAYACGMRTLVVAGALVLAAPGLRAACDDPPREKVDWSKCSKQRLVLKGASLAGARFERSILVGINFETADLRRTNFSSAEATRSSFRGAVMEEAVLQKLVCVRSTFRDARLPGVDLEKAEFHRCDLAGATLRGANLSKGDFGRSVFDRADLSGANFRYSSLSRASLRGAKLDGADFTQAYLFAVRVEATDLSAAKGLQQAQIELACGDAKTKLPAALRRPSSWPCTE
jgi:uncharacterized protein YjbI with pentapeptide repeats